MAKKEERFEVIFRDGSSFKDEGIRQILVDKETGVNQCLLIESQTLDFTDFCPIFWYNNCKDFDENKSFFLQFFYRQIGRAHV